MEELVSTLKVAFANTFVFHLKSWGFHWNLEGSDFFQYHQLFDTIYSDAQSAIDPLAEHIRQLQKFAPFTTTRITVLSEIEESSTIPAIGAMVEVLLKDNEVVIESLQKAYDLAEAAKEHALSNYLAERMASHKKHAWFLRSSSKKKD